MSRPRTARRRVVDGVESFHCPKCDKWMPKGGFSKLRRDPLGIDCYCRVCQNPPGIMRGSMPKLFAGRKARIEAERRASGDAA